ncbi:PTS system glucose-specific EIICBA component [Candidatus Izimaplasma bacterium HR1]|uniref:N-acetylglucosamine-specific PTS transporter subunit IIBC n=1 Tax=Candidatus Izimoplasma sp. HR1 TaxID=1541959 RepID=UPI0004F5B566|nr:PTS system glucose-specific EIICBA component [Candidatus Izimaplasma bacterium HR1]
MKGFFSNVLGYLQKIGRSLMLPVAVLPAAALLMGIGYWIDPNGWGGDSQVAAILIKTGASIIDNMSILFAVGVAYGMSKTKDGSAALSGLVSFLVVTTVLSSGSVAQITGVDPASVNAAFGKISNQFIGIIAGIIGATAFNRFGHVELPKALSFFSGKRLVPIVSAVVSLLVSVVLLFVWPVIFTALVGFGESIISLDAVGAGVYGFFNRLLIPFGLHHALNSVFWFDVAGINDIPNFLGGQTSIDAGTGILGITGMYQAGFFPVMMFGLPAAALAMVHTAKKKNKVKVASLMLAAGLASFFTGVTEPIEFAFLFVAPLLFLAHAVLTGISVFIAASFQWIAGFGFSAGFVDFVLSARNPLAQNWYMLILQGIVFGLIYYFLFKFLILKFNLKTPGREEDDEDGEPSLIVGKASHREVAVKMLAALGGKANIVELDNCITRLRLVIKDISVVDEKALKAAGATALMKISKTNIQVIVGTQVQFVADEMKKLK